ncbi:MAG: hypothetical protein ACRES3_10755 [Steroidobacteraceae bacterium]
MTRHSIDTTLYAPADKQECRPSLGLPPDKQVILPGDDLASAHKGADLAVRARNERIVAGEWRPLNLQPPPFGLPPPLRLINENCTEGNGAYRDKALGLWDLTTLRPPADSCG